ncbi:MAG TPA: Mur ligase domain-containing protein, partial [Candidatus Rubrimentiphilum sp.]|nr:Mur ligase domain-containing protein [Candidatus Rubrimentiphilum sp.]
MTFTLEDAARATGGQAYNPQGAPRSLTIVTDTRTLRPGDAFLALRGERFDGHDFVEDAVAKGASALIIEKPPTVNTVPYVVVPDTRRAYMNLAAAARATFSGRV